MPVTGNTIQIARQKPDRKGGLFSEAKPSLTVGLLLIASQLRQTTFAIE